MSLFSPTFPTLVETSPYAPGNEMHGRDLHVVLHGSHWAIKREGSPSVIRVFWIKSEAIDFGRLQAARERVRLLVHRRDGIIEDSEPNTSVAFG